MNKGSDFSRPHDRTINIGVFSPVVGGFYFGKTLSGIAKTARIKGHRITAMQTFEADLDRERFPESAHKNGLPALDHVDGAVVITAALDDEALAALRANKKPIVCIGQRAMGLDLPTVAPDNRGGVRAAVKHLMWHGHTQIGFVGNPHQSDVRERFDAYRETLREHDVVFTQNWVVVTDDNQEGEGYRAGKQWLEKAIPTTATFVATDRNALGFIRALREAGMTMPQDHAVIAFDHSEVGSRIRPRLSTVDPHHDKVGELAAKLLLDQVSGVGVTQQVHLAQSTLVTRESCGCVELGQRGLKGEGSPDRIRVSAFEELAEVAELVFTGTGSSSASGSKALHVSAWVSTVSELVRSAAVRATTPGAHVMERITDATTALQPHPEALESLVAVLRLLEDECRETLGARSGAQQTALRATVTRITVAVTKGCTRALMNRSGALERMLSNQYEIDLSLMRVDVSNPRTLSWLPATFKGGAALALWVDSEVNPDQRKLEIVGARGVGSTGSRLVGTRTTAQAFPPPNLLRALSGNRQDILFIIPVTFAGSDWGLLAIAGTADTRSTSARDRFNHWAAMLAVALDHEKLLRDLRMQQEDLKRLAQSRSELTQAVKDSEERFALASAATYEGMWDWDVLTGRVYYSPQWMGSLQISAQEAGNTLDTWTARVHPDDQLEMQTAIARQMAGLNEPFHLVQRLQNGHGEYLSVEVKGLTLTNDAGIPSRIVGSIVVLGRSASAVGGVIDQHVLDGRIEYDSVSDCESPQGQEKAPIFDEFAEHTR